jgi:hypothetical protein
MQTEREGRKERRNEGRDEKRKDGIDEGRKGEHQVVTTGSPSSRCPCPSSLPRAQRPFESLEPALGQAQGQAVAVAAGAVVSEGTHYVAAAGVVAAAADGFSVAIAWALVQVRGAVWTVADNLRCRTACQRTPFG